MMPNIYTFYFLTAPKIVFFLKDFVQIEPVILHIFARHFGLHTAICSYKDEALLIGQTWPGGWALLDC